MIGSSVVFYQNISSNTHSDRILDSMKENSINTTCIRYIFREGIEKTQPLNNWFCSCFQEPMSNRRLSWFKDSFSISISKTNKTFKSLKNELLLTTNDINMVINDEFEFAVENEDQYALKEFLINQNLTFQEDTLINWMNKTSKKDLVSIIDMILWYQRDRLSLSSIIKIFKWAVKNKTVGSFKCFNDVTYSQRCRNSGNTSGSNLGSYIGELLLKVGATGDNELINTILQIKGVANINFINHELVSYVGKLLIIAAQTGNETLLDSLLEIDGVSDVRFSSRSGFFVYDAITTSLMCDKIHIAEKLSLIIDITDSSFENWKGYSYVCKWIMIAAEKNQVAFLDKQIERVILGKQIERLNPSIYKVIGEKGVMDVLMSAFFDQLIFGEIQEVKKIKKEYECSTRYLLDAFEIAIQKEYPNILDSLMKMEPLLDMFIRSELRMSKLFRWVVDNNKFKCLNPFVKYKSFAGESLVWASKNNEINFLDFILSIQGAIDINRHDFYIRESLRCAVSNKQVTEKILSIKGVTNISNLDY